MSTTGRIYSPASGDGRASTTRVIRGSTCPNAARLGSNEFPSTAAPPSSRIENRIEKRARSRGPAPAGCTGVVAPGPARARPGSETCRFRTPRFFRSASELVVNVGQLRGPVGASGGGGRVARLRVTAPSHRAWRAGSGQLEGPAHGRGPPVLVSRIGFRPPRRNRSDDSRPAKLPDRLRMPFSRRMSPFRAAASKNGLFERGPRNDGLPPTGSGNSSGRLAPPGVGLDRVFRSRASAIVLPFRARLLARSFRQCRSAGAHAPRYRNAQPFPRVLCFRFPPAIGAVVPSYRSMRPATRPISPASKEPE